MSAPFPYAGESAALLSSLLWACAFLGFARPGAPVPAGALNLGKNGTASLCFAVVFTLLAGHPWPEGLRPLPLALLLASGVAGLTLCDTLLFRAMQVLGPQRTTVLMLVAVPLTVLASLLPPLSEPVPRAGAWLGIAACLVGVALAATERRSGALDPAAARRGLLYGLLAALLQATGVVLTRWALREQGGHGALDAAAAATVRLYVGTAGLVVLALATRRLGVWGRALAQPRVAPRLMLAAFFGTFLGIWGNAAGLTWAANSGVATTLNQLAPVWLIPLTTAFLGERHGLRCWIATLVAVGGVVLIGLFGPR